MSGTAVINAAENRIGAIETGKNIWAWAADEAASVGRWMGGAIAGEFSQQQTTGQIVFDAIISMFPLLGEGTAARDGVAISMRMSASREALESRWEWIKLVLCAIAVVPVLGGALKGVGKLVVRAFEKSEDLTKLAEEIVMFLNRMGHGNAVEWLKKLDFTAYQGKVTSAIGEMLDRLSRASQFIVNKMGAVLPAHVTAYLSALPQKLQTIKRVSGYMIPQALKDLNEGLARVRANLVEAKWEPISVGSGKVTTREMEGQLTTAALRGQKMKHPPATVADYGHKEGWPDLRTGSHRDAANRKGTIKYTVIESFSKDSKIEAATLAPGKHDLSRVLDNTTRVTASGRKLTGTLSVRTKRSPNWLPYMPKTGKEWREEWAILMDWNHNGAFIHLDHIPDRDQLVAMGVTNIPADWNGLRIWRGRVSSQYDPQLGRWLDGGQTQYIIDFEHPYNKVLEDYVTKLTGMPTYWNDVIFEPVTRSSVRPLRRDEIMPKTITYGYTTRAPAAFSQAIPDRKE